MWYTLTNSSRQIWSRHRRFMSWVEIDVYSILCNVIVEKMAKWVSFGFRTRFWLFRRWALIDEKLCGGNDVWQKEKWNDRHTFTDKQRQRKVIVLVVCIDDTVQLVYVGCEIPTSARQRLWVIYIYIMTDGWISFAVNVTSIIID